MGGDKARFVRLVLLALLLAAFGLRAGSLTAQSLWRDEVDALCYAFEFPNLVAQALAPQAASDQSLPNVCPPPPIPSRPAQSRQPLPNRLVQTLWPMVRQNGPLYFFLLRGWIWLAGYSEYSLRFFSLWFGVLAVPLTYALGRRLLGRGAAVLAAGLVAVSPYLIWYSQEVKMYALTPLLALLALYGLRRAVESGGWWWAVQVGATSLAFYTHIWSALLVPVEVLLLLVWWPRWRPHWRGALVSLALLTLPYLPLALWQAPALLRERETGFARYSLGWMSLILLNGWDLGIVASGWPAWAIRYGVASILGCGGAALAGLLVGLARRSYRRATLALSTWLLLPLVGIYLVSLRQPLFTDRYLIWTAPAFYLLAGGGLVSLWKGTTIALGGDPPTRMRLRARWLALCLLAVTLISFAINLRVQATQSLKADTRSAAAYVEEGYQPDDLLLFQIPHIHYTFDYYFGPQEYAWADGLYTNHHQPDGSYLMSEGAAASQMAQLTRGYRTVWLVATEVEMWDERDLVRGWLEANAERTAVAHFNRVDVYRYRLDASP